MTYKYLNWEDPSRSSITCLGWAIPGQLYPLKVLPSQDFFSVWFCQMFHWQLEILELEDVACISLIILNVNIFFFSDVSLMLPGNKSEAHSYRKAIENAIRAEVRQWSNPCTQNHKGPSSGMGSGIGKFLILFMALLHVTWVIVHNLLIFLYV